MKHIKDQIINALGSPNFNSDEVFEALENIPKNGSIIALLAILPDLETFAKKNYGKIKL